MEKGNDIRRPLNLPERKHRRFSISYPVVVKFPLGSAVSALEAVSNNISLSGVLLEAESSIPQNSDVTFTMTVRQHHIVGPIQLVGEGTVVRVEPHRSGSGFAIAVKCSRPLSKLDEYLPPSAN